MKGKYRNADSVVEIDSILDEKITEDCLIWQNLFGERVVHQIYKIEKDEENRVLKCRIQDYNLKFDTKQPVYIKLDYRGTMFKTQVRSINNDVIHLNYPLGEDVKTIELRGEPRTNFNLKDEKYISMGVLHDGKLQNEQKLLFQLMDISESGLCVLVSDQNKNYLKSSLVLALSHLGDIELPYPLLLEQKYSTPYRYRKDGKNFFAIRVGFELSQKFEENILNEFLKK